MSISRFELAWEGEFRVHTDRLQRLRSLAELATEAAVNGEPVIRYQPRIQPPSVVLPYAYRLKSEWTPATVTSFTKNAGSQRPMGIELVNDANESLAVYDASTANTDTLILVRDGAPWELPLDDQHFETTYKQIALLTQRFLDQL